MNIVKRLAAKGVFLGFGGDGNRVKRRVNVTFARYQKHDYK